jgi:predicted SAM-dependent methyltransferase
MVDEVPQAEAAPASGRTNDYLRRRRGSSLSDHRSVRISAVSYHPAMRETRVERLGSAIRRVPGGRLPLELRNHIRARRAARAVERREAALQQRDHAWIASLRGRHDMRVNIGSSGEHVEGWVNADILRDPEGRCLRMDATERWPFEDCSAEAINSEHVIEHLERADAPAFFAEAFRVLRPGGVIRTSTPDLRGIAEAYIAEDAATLAAHRAHGYEARNHADLLNNYLQMHGHRHVYDFETLALLLREAGFEEIERTAFGESTHAVLRGVDTHEMGELSGLVVCVDAVRPPSGASA